MPLASISATDLLFLPFAFPLGSLLIAIVVAGAILTFAPSRRRRQHTAGEVVTALVTGRYAREHRTLAFSAFAVVLLFAVENILSGYVLPLSDVISWWRYATPLAAATLALLVAFTVIRVRGTRASQVPVMPVVRRTWVSFGPRNGLLIAALVAALLIGTTIAAGAASSADEQGRFAWLVVPVPNEAGVDPMRPLFYGWAYGLPVLAATLALLVAGWAFLHANAVRPYIRPDSVPGERQARADIARSGVHIAIAGMLLALGGAWRLVARAGSTTQLTIMGVNDGVPYDVIWRYAGLASAAGWLAPVLEITAFTLLLIVAASGAKQRVKRAAPDAVDTAALIGVGR